MKNDVWEIVKKEDGTFDISQKGQLLHKSVPDTWLENQLARCGLCGQEYHDIRRQLEQVGRAKIIL